MNWLSHIPVWLTLPLFAATAAIIAVLAHRCFRAFVPTERLSAHHDVTGALASVVGVLYSVVLGFLVGTVWTSFDAAQQTADEEAWHVANAFGFASELPEPARSRVQNLIARYAVEVRDVEWHNLSQGQSDPQARSLLNDAIRNTLAVSPPGNVPPGQVLKAESVVDATTNSLRNVSNYRAARIAQARDRLPQVVFEALILGALMVMAFAFLFGVRPVVLQMTLTALLAGCIGLFFGLIVDLNSPYSGPIRVSTEAWNSIIQSDRLESIAK